MGAFNGTPSKENLGKVQQWIDSNDLVVILLANFVHLLLVQLRFLVEILVDIRGKRSRF